MKDTLTSVASPISQKDLDSLLIKAAGNPQGEALDKDESIQTIAELLARGADVNAKAYDGVTALMIAAQRGHKEIVSALLSRKEIDVNASTYDGFTALMLAAENGRAEIVSDFLSRKEIDVNASTSDGFTALMLAADNGQTKIVAALLSREEINFNEVASNGFTALMFAAQNGHTKIVSALLSLKGIDVDAVPNRFTALMIAAQNGHTKIVSALLSRDGIYVEAATSEGFTALIIAAKNGRTETVSYLLSRDGIDVNAETSRGYTALMFAAKNGHTETVSYLLSRDGVDWKEVRNQLSHAALQNLNEEVSVLLAVIIPDDKLRNSIITSFNKRNSGNAINQKDNDILGSGLEMYKTLKDLEFWHKRYLTDPDSGLGHSENEAEISANQRFFDLLNRQEARQEAFARNDLIAYLVSKSVPLAADFVKGAKVKDQKDLDALKGLNPEDLYKLITKITDNDINVAAFEKDKTPPAKTIRHKSIEPIATTRQKSEGCVVS